MQNELPLDESGATGPDGLSAWRRQRQGMLDQTARANGLPLGHPCHVELRYGVTLDGLLVLADDELFVEVERNPELRLRIGKCTFTAGEIVSVARLD